MARLKVPSHVLRSRHSAAFAGSLGLLFLSVSCRNRAEQTIKDSEGRSFSAQCSDDRICVLSPKAGPGAEPGAEGRPLPARNEQSLHLKTSGRVVGVCGPVAPGAQPAPADCRPVICESASDCPASTGLQTGVCINGLCTEPSHALNSDDAVMLCLAQTGVGMKSATQVERLALGLNCGTPCQIPKPCRQP